MESCEDMRVKDNEIYNINQSDVEKSVEKSELSDKFPKTELREVEQYFFSEDVVRNLVDALEFEKNLVCLGTPAVAHGFWQYKQRNVLLLDIDRRFDYLPGYKYFDILSPSEIDIKPNIIIIDPPFFKMNLNDLFKCVDFLSKADRNTKILFVFVQREEKALLNIFKLYNLKLTKFKMEYRYVDPSKWSNYKLYSNSEFNKIKFFKDEKTKTTTIKRKIKRNK